MTQLRSLTRNFERILRNNKRLQYSLLPIQTNKQTQDYSPKQQLVRVHNRSVMAAALQFCLPSTAMRHHADGKQWHSLQDAN